MPKNIFWIVWNGCDGYSETDTGTAYYRSKQYNAFQVVPANLSDVPIDDDGEHDFSGFYLTDSGRLCREV